MPIMSAIVLSGPAFLPRALGPLAFFLQIFAVGYPGTERLWILRAMRGQPFTLSDAFGRTWSYWTRFLLLGLIISPVAAVGAGIGWLIDRHLIGAYLGVLVAGLLLDFGMTFVTPALAFSTRRVSEALKTGLRMIRSEWPRSALYVLVPPLAIFIVLQFAGAVPTFRYLQLSLRAVEAGRRPPPIPEPIRVINGSLTAVTAATSLLFKGATAAFYARRHQIGPYGATPDQRAPSDPPPRPDIPS